MPKSKSSGLFPSLSNFLPFGGGSSSSNTNNTSTIPSIHNQNHSERYGNVLQYKSVIDFGESKPFSETKGFQDIKPFGEKSLDDDLGPTVDLSSAPMDDAGSGGDVACIEGAGGTVSAIHPDVRRAIEDEEIGASPSSPSNSPVINRRRDRRALKKFRETSRHSRPMRGTGGGWTPDACEYIYSLIYIIIINSPHRIYSNIVY